MKKSTAVAPKYQPPKVIYIDVDGTLISGGQVNTQLVEWIREKYTEGYQIIVWSSRGTSNAYLGVAKAGLRDVVSHCLPKPGYIVDDKSWTWTRYTWQVKDFFDARINVRR